ncbi:hypothetical protein KY333_02740 [Candidatus Woesearchaeota archaeon]|nr:hypothetical protein [Candidatus Woesearchaeota archaeon]
MKYILFVHPEVEDPSKENPSFGRIRPDGPIEASAEGHMLQRYFDNKTIIDDLLKDNNVNWEQGLWKAADKLTRSDPLNNFNVLITNCPPNELYMPWARGEHDHLNYSRSLDCLSAIKKNKPDMKIIVYTGAPKVVRDKCNNLGAIVLHRDYFGLKIELSEIRKIIKS